MRVPGQGPSQSASPSSSRLSAGWLVSMLAGVAAWCALDTRVHRKESWRHARSPGTDKASSIPGRALKVPSSASQWRLVRTKVCLVPPPKEGTRTTRAAKRRAPQLLIAPGSGLDCLSCLLGTGRMANRHPPWQTPIQGLLRLKQAMHRRRPVVGPLFRPSAHLVRFTFLASCR